jgi:hypothetical protein
MIKPVDRVHGAVDRWRARVHGGPRAVRTGDVMACGAPDAMGPGSSPAVAEDEKGNEAEPVRVHQSSNGDGDAARRRQRTTAA